MASRRVSTMHKNHQPIPSESKSSKVGSEQNSGPAKKTKSGGTMVKSRYMQSVDKALSKSNELTKSDVVPPRPTSPKPSGVKPRVGTPPRRSMAPQSLATRTPPRRTMAPQTLPTSMMSTLLEPTQLGKTILQSTMLEGHCNHPDFDVSVIKDRAGIQNIADVSAGEEYKRDIENQTILLTYLTAKMEHNTRKFKAEAEGHLLAVMEEEEELRKEVQKKKRQYLLLEKRKQLNDLLDSQIAALTPVAAAAQQFTDEYKSFAVAVDTTRHELPVKNVYIEGDRREFLNKAEACLKKSEQLLLQCTEGDQQDNHTSAECLRGLKAGAQDIGEELSGGVSELLELSSLVTRRTVLMQQSLEEQQLGFRAQELYCPAPKQ